MIEHQREEVGDGGGSVAISPWRRRAIAARQAPRQYTARRVRVLQARVPQYRHRNAGMRPLFHIQI